MAKPGAQTLMRRATDEVDLGCNVYGPPDAGNVPRYSPPCCRQRLGCTLCGRCGSRGAQTSGWDPWLTGLLCGCSTARSHLGCTPRLCELSEDLSGYPQHARADARSAGRPGRILGECRDVKIPLCAVPPL